VDSTGISIRKNACRSFKRLSDIKGLEWIRLHYAYPHKFPLEILDGIAERSNICNYLDIPLQHAANNMLSAMKRQITREEIEELVSTIREKVPGICIRTTLIAGFPGETLDDVEELKLFLKQQRFDRVGILPILMKKERPLLNSMTMFPRKKKKEGRRRSWMFSRKFLLKRITKSWKDL